MRSIEAWLNKLENESKALKTAFVQSATSLRVFTDETNFTTAKNTITVVVGGQTYYHDNQERVLVTFDTNNGADTLAKIELTCSQEYLPAVRRVPYSGGARFMITNVADQDASGNWRATTYRIVIQSFVEGKVRAENMTL
jgi:hypothetical protein